MEGFRLASHTVWTTLLAFTCVLLLLLSSQSGHVQAQGFISHNHASVVTSEAEVPPSLVWHTSTLLALPADHVSVTVGGGLANDIANNRATIRTSPHTWVFSHSLNMWSRCEIHGGPGGARPSSRMHHAAARITPLSVYNASASPSSTRGRGAASKLLIIGGASFFNNTISINNDLWQLEIWRSPIETQSFFTCAWTKLDAPEAMAARFLPAVASYDDPFELYVVGGCLHARRMIVPIGENSATFLQCLQSTDEVWRFTDATQWTLLTQVTAPSASGSGFIPPHLNAHLFPVGARDNRTLMLFGGFEGNGVPYSANASLCTFGDPESTDTFSCEFLGEACHVSRNGSCVGTTRFISRGAHITHGNRVFLFGVADGVSDALLGFVYVYDPADPRPRFHLVDSLSRLLAPVFSGASSRIGLLGGFSATPLVGNGEAEQFLFFGDFFRPQTGDAWHTWLYTPQNLSPSTDSTELSGVWQDKFYYRSMTARAWPVSQTLGRYIILLGGYTGATARSDWKFDVAAVLEQDKALARAVERSNDLRGSGDDDDREAAAEEEDEDEDEDEDGDIHSNDDEQGIPQQALTAWMRLDELADDGAVRISRFKAASVVVNASTMFVFGGQKDPRGACLNSSFFFIPETHRVEVIEGVGTSPPARRGASLVRLGNDLYLFGGETCTNEHLFFDVWRFDLSTYEWENVQEAGAPFASSFHTTAALTTHDGVEEMVVFGGFRQRSKVDYHFVWAFNPRNNTWRIAHPATNIEPSERTSHCTAVMEAGPIASQVVVIGGSDVKGSELGDAWSYHHASQTWHRLRDEHNYFQLSPKRFGHTCTSFNDTVVVIGGTSQQRFFRTIVAFRPTCNPGFRAQGSCTPCKQRYFRSELANPECERCSSDLTTQHTGAASAQECSVCRSSACRHGQGTAIHGDCICRCHFGFAGKTCNINVLGIVLGSIIGVGTLALATFYVLRHYRRTAASIQQHSALQQRLLDEKEQEIELFEQIWTISPEELQFVRVLDEGAFGRVELMVWLSTGLDVAVKRLREAILQLDDTSQEDFVREVKFVRQLRHPNIVRFHGAFLGARPFLVMEYVERGSLQHILATPSIELSDACRHSFLCDTAAGMEYLHRKGRMHRDLKSANLLVTSDWRIKVTDFTTAKDVMQDALTRQRRASMHASAVKRPASAVISEHGRQHTLRAGHADGGGEAVVAAAASAEPRQCRASPFCKSMRIVRDIRQRTLKRGNKGHQGSRPDAGDGDDFVNAGADGGTGVADEERSRAIAAAAAAAAAASDHVGGGGDASTNVRAQGATSDTDSSGAGDDSTDDADELSTESSLMFTDGSIWTQTTGIGTIPWSAPEVLANQAYGLPADVYSFGIVISEIITRQLPYWDYQGNIRRGVLRGVRPTMPREMCDPRYIELACKCWCHDAAARWTFSKVSEFLAGWDGTSGSRRATGSGVTTGAGSAIHKRTGETAV